MGACCIAVSLGAKFRTAAWRQYRAAMFVGMGLSALLPVAHGLVLFGVEQMDKQISLSWLVLQGYLYILGAIVYVVRYDTSS